MLNDPYRVKEDIKRWIRDYFEENGKGCFAVIGISGGKDSSVAAALCAEALGKDRVVGVLMPNGIQSDLEDAKRLAAFLGIPHLILNIGTTSAALCQELERNEALQALTGRAELSADSKINLPPRIRMTTLYAVAQSLPGGGRVVNTCNRSEDYIGYSTKYGDSAGDFSPLSDFWVEEVRELGHALGLPKDLVEKTPSDGLSGCSDEEKLGFSYQTLSAYVLTGVCEDEAVREKIDRLHRANLHKLKPMPAYKR
ncbi:MAG: NAD(+) synthase [Clostridia bacterium]|nr:NAD(+) synthase [Clostridia bacterium]